MFSVEVCENARLSRDARFDGKFFTAVITTGIFCRPICPASPPKPENVTYYESAELAQKSGFRPCKRCFPQLAPNLPLPRKINQITQAYYENGFSLQKCAEQLEISDRQIRRAVLWISTFRVFSSATIIASAQTTHYNTLKYYKRCFRCRL